jgi:hypothetical protein
MRSFGLLFLVACGGGVATVDVDAGTNADGSTSHDGSVISDGSSTQDATLPPLDAGAFCTGSSPRLMINGSEVSVFNTSGKAIALNCCDSSEVLVASGAYQALLAVIWRATPTKLPTDLGNPPNGFQMELDLGCDPAMGSCDGHAEERYTSGFQGTLSYAQNTTGYTVNYCLSVAESASTPHPLIHSLMLYAPNVTTKY